MSVYFMSQSNLRYWIKFIYIFIYMYIYQNLKIPIFTIYKTPDVQSTNVKHDSSICPENIR